jgi:hypothetical protein
VPLIQKDSGLMIDVPSESKGRAKYFGDKTHRQAVALKGKEVSMEFCNGLLGTSVFFLQSTITETGSKEAGWLMVRFQYTFSPTTTPIQAFNPINEILGRTTRYIRLSEAWSTWERSDVCCWVRDC